MPLRVVLVGAGSHVFGLSMLSQFLLENDFPGIELVLVDPDETAGKRIEAAANKLRAGCAVWSSELGFALPEANYVICAAAVQMHRRFERDREIIDRLAPGHLISEFGGVYGAASTLRQLTLIEKICAGMRQHCPRARLLMISNPMPRLVAAATSWEIETLGFCSVSLVGFNLVARLLGEEEETYPFDRLRDKYRLVSAGTNHLAWLSVAEELATGRSVLQQVKKAWEATANVTKSIAVAREVGVLPVSGDDHIQDFLPPIGLEHSLEHVSHGSSEDRDRMNATLDRFAAGGCEWSEIAFPPSWERPGDVVRALEGGASTLISSLNLPNRGQIPSLGTGGIVETPVMVDGDGLHPEPVTLPAEAASWCHRCHRVTDHLLAAYKERTWAELHAFLDVDPTVIDKESASAALQEIVLADEDLLGAFH